MVYDPILEFIIYPCFHHRWREQEKSGMKESIYEYTAGDQSSSCRTSCGDLDSTWMFIVVAGGALKALISEVLAKSGEST